MEISEDHQSTSSNDLKEFGVDTDEPDLFNGKSFFEFRQSPFFV